MDSQNSPANILSKIKRVKNPRQLAEEQKLRGIIEKYRDNLIKKGATGIGIGMKIKNGQVLKPYQLCISVQVRVKSDTVDQIPTFLDGIPTDVISTKDLTIITDPRDQ